MILRFSLVNTFSFFKRFFAFSPAIYKVIVVIPILAILTFKLSKKSLNFIVFFLLLTLIMGKILYCSSFIIYFALLLVTPMFRRVNFEKFLSKTLFLFWIVSIYGIYQKIFGYSTFEVNWIQSGLSFAEERSLMNTSDIRPFSTFASMPEFTLFIAIYVYYFSVQKKILLLSFSLIMLYIAGSRGVIISTLIAYFFTFVLKKYNRKRLLVAFFASLMLFLFLIFIFPIVINAFSETNRMFVYGTFNGRIELIKNVLEKSSLLILLKGIDIHNLGFTNTFDNLYLMLIAHFGLFGAFFFLLFFLNLKIDQKNFYFFSIFLGYGFYADMVFSFYLMFLFFFAIHSHSNLGIISYNKRYIFKLSKLA